MELVGMDLKETEREDINALLFLKPHEISWKFLQELEKKYFIKRFFQQTNEVKNKIRKNIGDITLSRSIALNESLIATLFPFSYELQNKQEKLVYRGTKDLAYFSHIHLNRFSLDVSCRFFPHMMIIGPNNSNKILVFNNGTLQMIDLISKKNEIIRCHMIVKGLVALHPTKKIFLYIAGSDHGILELANFENPQDTQSTTLPYERDRVMGEDSYQPFLNKAIFIGENLFVGMTGPNIFLYNYGLKKCVWGEITCRQIAKRAGIKIDRKKCIVNNFHYSEKFHDRVVIDFDVVSSEDEDNDKKEVDMPEAITRYAVALEIKSAPSPKIIGSFTFTRTKKEGGWYDYSNNYAFYKFIDSSGPDLHIDLRCLGDINAENAKHINIHTMPTGIANKVIDLGLLMNGDYRFIELFLKVICYSKNLDVNREKCAEIFTRFKELTMARKKELFCMTTQWSPPKLDEKTKKTYRNMHTRSPLWDIFADYDKALIERIRKKK